ncbi:MAG: hypothetical protein MSC30_18490 [Gaiellaceae bacterium MAG52_C11]|nr:hypothetical protein [Candidatus Gaiellasilicea maunaloa]
MALADDLARIAEAAAARAAPGEQVAAVLPTEPHAEGRLYLCAFETSGGERSWLALGDDAGAVVERQTVRDAISIAALCELAEEVAAGGDLDELHAQLVALRLTENPDGIDEAEEAVLELQRVIGSPPALATPARLDAIGLATRRLELALGGALQGSPFAEAMRGAADVVDALTSDVERTYRADLR